MYIFICIYKGHKNGKLESVFSKATITGAKDFGKYYGVPYVGETLVLRYCTLEKGLWGSNEGKKQSELWCLLRDGWSTWRWKAERSKPEGQESR